MTYAILTIACILVGAAWVRKPKEYQPPVVYSPNPELVLFTQWQLRESSHVLYAQCADELECWCREVDRYQKEQYADVWYFDEQWSEAHEHRLRRSLEEV